MKLHTVFITYNRLELTKRAIESYLGHIEGPRSWLVVDNDSTDSSRNWLEANEIPYWPMEINAYPGMACNTGWRLAPDDATHLHRADNDHIFLPGWCEALEEAFLEPKVGLVGLRTSEEELHAASNVGGNCVIDRRLWDKGLRWDERTWPQLREEVGPGVTEDSLLAPAVRQMGFQWTRVQRPCIQPISSELPDLDPDWPYYLQTFRDRGIHKHLTEKTT